MRHLEFWSGSPQFIFNTRKAHTSLSLGTRKQNKQTKITLKVKLCIFLKYILPQNIGTISNKVSNKNVSSQIKYKGLKNHFLHLKVNLKIIK